MTKTQIRIEQEKMNTGFLLGRNTASVGDVEEITLGTGLSFTGTTLNATGGGGPIPISDLLDATSGNSIDNLDFEQQWSWDTLADSAGLHLSANTTEADSNDQILLHVELSGTNANANQTTYAGYFSNEHDGTGSVNVGAYFAASGAVDNWAAVFGANVMTDQPNFTIHNHFGGGTNGSVNINSNKTEIGMNSANFLVGGENIATTISTVTTDEDIILDTIGTGANIFKVDGTEVARVESNYFLGRILKRLVTVNTPGATPSTDTDTLDIAEFTDVDTAITSMTTNLSGTPYNGDMVEFIFLDDGTARAITWGAGFVDGPMVALPTTTVISTVLRVLVQYQTIASLNKWVCIAVA